MTIVIHPDGTQFPRNESTWPFDYSDLWASWHDYLAPKYIGDSLDIWFSVMIVEET